MTDLKPLSASKALNYRAGNANGSALPPTFEGPLALNERLHGVQVLFKGTIIGSESVAVAANGDLIMLDRQGFVHRATRKAAGYVLDGAPMYAGPGRPLGFHVHGDDLFICDSLKGLLRMSLGDGRLEILSNAISGVDGAPPEPFNYANDLDVAADGTIYFTSCTDGPVARNPAGDFYDTSAAARVEPALARCRVPAAHAKG